MSVCIIFNPRAGKNRGRHRIERLRRLLGSRADFRQTNEAGSGEELAKKAVQEGFQLIGAAGGDGTVHEVANGILRAGRSEVVLAVLPIGSANDYAYSLGLTEEWWRRRDLPIATQPVDVGLVRSPEGRDSYFVNNLGVGFNGAVSLESERIRGLQGTPLYLSALLRALCVRYCHPLMTITIDDKTRQEPTLAFSLGIGRREGSFLLAPQAKLDDGLFDYLHAGRIPRWELLRYLPGIMSGRLPADHPRLRLGHCRSANVQSATPLTVHMDGELFCRPEHHVCSLEVQILPHRLRVLRRLSHADVS